MLENIFNIDDNIDGEKTLFLYDGERISAAYFRKLIFHWATVLKRENEERIILHTEDNFLFAVGFFALLYAGKEVILASNVNTDYLTDISTLSNTILTDKPLNSGLNTIYIKNDSVDFMESFEMLNPKELYITFFTSGSSAKPKIIRKSLQNLELEAQEVGDFLKREFEAVYNESVILGSVKSSHLYGMIFYFLAPLLAGVKIDLDLIEFPEQLEEKLRKNRQNIFISTPSFLEKLHRYSDVYQFENTCVGILSAGAKLPSETAIGMRDIFGIYPVEIYGSTETGTIASKHFNELWKKFATVNMDMQNDLLIVKSPFFLENSLIIQDIIEIKKDGFILKGRADRLVKIAEKRLSLDALEEKILEDELIDRCHCFILDNKTLSCVIVPTKKGMDFLIENGKTQLEKNIKHQISSKFDAIFFPKKWRVVNKIPVNKQGKIEASKIQAMFEDNLAKPLIIEEITDENSVTLKLIFLEDSIYFKGHFDGLPILAGVAQVHFAVQYIGEYFTPISNIKEIKKLKFTDLIFPNKEVILKLKRNENGSYNFTYMGKEKYSSGVIYDGNTNV